MRRRQFQLIADEFWTAAGGREPFPCRLESSILWALPVAVIKLPRLWVYDVEAWLTEKGIHFQFGMANRALHGSMLAYRGRGCILLNGADNDSELRYSLAHEAAHFILNYLRPRRKAVSLIGPNILEVFDGFRVPTVRERVHGILGHIPIGFHVHLMDRSAAGLVDQDAILDVEDSTDLLALEIVSPENEVRRRVSQALSHEYNHSSVDVAAKILKDEFGLPSGVVDSYAHYLYPKVPAYSVRYWLRQREE